MEEIRRIINEIEGQELFSYFGNLASILSLIITSVVYFTLHKIKSGYLFQARIPDLIKKLKSHTKNLSTYSENFDNSKNGVISELSMCKANIKSVREKTPKDIRKQIMNINGLINEYLADKKNSKDDFWEIYSKIIILITAVENYYKDREWR